MSGDGLGVVVIGRNEGERLARCLASVRELPSRVYVDSGSTDGSVALAEREGVQAVQLPIPPNFTAARARNTGIRALTEAHPEIGYVFTIDGDCEVQPGWIEAGLRTLREDPRLALVFGRRRERFPDRSIYNALCDDEWNLPVGEAAGCGGDAIFRAEALAEVGGYEDSMIAGEDSELSMRLRKKGWRLRRIDAEMTLHDAAMTRFGQWWQRTKRSGYGYGEMAHRHPDARDPNWPRTCRSILIWGAVLPVLLVLLLLAGVLHHPLWLAGAVAIVGLWWLKVAQLFVRQKRRGLSVRMAAASGFFLMLGKLAQLQGLVRFHRDRWAGRAGGVLIEYKGGDRG